MRRRSQVTCALLSGAVAAAIAGCGSNASTSATATPTPSIGSGASTPFCQQAAQVAAQLTSLSAGLVGTTPGATPSVTTYQQIFASTAQAIDSLDGSAPSEIANAFHVVRAAYDQANTEVQAATSSADLGTAMSALSSSTLTTANTTISNYFTNVCGISASASTTAPAPTPT